MAASRGGQGPIVCLVLACLALWALLFVAVPPRAQDFPLNDDWAYAKGAFAFARGRGIHYFGWASMPLLGQWVWAWPFLKVIGESHVALRLSTITLSVLGVAAFYDLLRREAALDARRAALAAAGLAANPLFFLLSGTYLSDVPALSLSLVALALYQRGLQETGGSAALRLAGAAGAATLAVLTRQNAVAAPVAAGLALLLRRPSRLEPRRLLAVAVPVTAGVAALLWFRTRPDVIPVSPQAPQLWASLQSIFTAWHFLGLAAVPVLVAIAGRVSWTVFGLSAFALGVGAWGLAEGELFPYLGNLLTPWGAFGAPGLVVGERPLLLGPGARLTLTVVGCLAGAWLLAAAAPRFRRPPGLLALFTLAHAALLLVTPQQFDRYLVVLLPGALLAAGAEEPGRFRSRVGIAVVLLFSALSFGLMRDWLAWNSARWTLGRRAVAGGIPATDIEGGFEWDGWHSPRAASRKHVRRDGGLMLRFTGGWFPRITGRYALAFSPPPGTVRLDAEAYRLWLPPTRSELLLVAPGESSP
jgi:4-amino-4-deoxy-L-arabinose transferase-like glycosyltransferase